jgi:hypothetical protein
MTARSWSGEIARREMARLVTPGVLGFYTHFEATVVFGLPRDAFVFSYPFIKRLESFAQSVPSLRHGDLL